ncbi:MAG: hypothetical protein PVJ21_22035 [Anaerolineales bacterium]
MDHYTWLNLLFENLEQYGQEGRATVTYFKTQRTKIRFKETKPSIGAWWTIGRNINLNTRYYSYENSLDNTRVFTLLIHEARHLQQGFFTALSVYGELDAWQLEWSIYYRKHGRYPKKSIEELMNLQLGWDRDMLRRAVALMQDYASKDYRADLLPYYPLGKEIAYRLFKKIPDTIMQSA